MMKDGRSDPSFWQSDGRFPSKPSHAIRHAGYLFIYVQQMFATFAHNRIDFLQTFSRCLPRWPSAVTVGTVDGFDRDTIFATLAVHRHGEFDLDQLYLKTEVIIFHRAIMSDHNPTSNLGQEHFTAFVAHHLHPQDSQLDLGFRLHTGVKLSKMADKYKAKRGEHVVLAPVVAGPPFDMNLTVGEIGLQDGSRVFSLRIVSLWISDPVHNHDPKMDTEYLTYSSRKLKAIAEEVTLGRGTCGLVLSSDSGKQLDMDMTIGEIESQFPGRIILSHKEKQQPRTEPTRLAPADSTTKEYPETTQAGNARGCFEICIAHHSCPDDSSKDLWFSVNSSIKLKSLADQCSRQWGKHVALAPRVLGPPFEADRTVGQAGLQDKSRIFGLPNRDMWLVPIAVGHHLEHNNLEMYSEYRSYPDCKLSRVAEVLAALWKVQECKLYSEAGAALDMNLTVGQIWLGYEGRIKALCSPGAGTPVGPSLGELKNITVEKKAAKVDSKQLETSLLDKGRDQPEGQAQQFTSKQLNSRTKTAALRRGEDPEGGPVQQGRSKIKKTAAKSLLIEKKRKR